MTRELDRSAAPTPAAGRSMRLVPAMLLGLLLAAAVPSAAAQPRLAGQWVLNHELTREEQPDGPEQRRVLDALPSASVSVGGVPLPSQGRERLPQAMGSPRDPSVLQTTTLGIDAVDGDRLRLTYDGGVTDELQRGNDQGLVSRWSDRKLTSRYQTTRRTVSQTYQVRRDGRLLVTIRLKPNRAAAVVHKRVFDPAPGP